MANSGEETYGDDRRRELEALLLRIAERIKTLAAEGKLLQEVPDLMAMLGEARSELFAWEVHHTYDTPEVAESRRIVDEALSDYDFLNNDLEDDEPWRHHDQE